MMFCWSWCLLYKSVLLCQAAPFLVPWLEEAVFCGHFVFLPVSIGVSGLLACPSTSLGYVRQKGNPKKSLPCGSSDPRAPQQSASSIQFSVFLYLFYLGYQGFGLTSEGRIIACVSISSQSRGGRPRQREALWICVIETVSEREEVDIGRCLRWHRRLFHVS